MKRISLVVCSLALVGCVDSHDGATLNSFEGPAVYMANEADTGRVMSMGSPALQGDAISSVGDVIESPEPGHIEEIQRWHFIRNKDEIENLWRAHQQGCQNGCEVVSSAMSSRNKHSTHGHLEMRVDRNRLTDFEEYFESLGVPSERSVTRSDRTLEVIDIEARIAGQERLLKRLTGMLENHPTDSLQSLLQIEREIARVQSGLDAMKTQRRVLSSRTDKVRLSLSYEASLFIDQESAWRPVKAAYHNALFVFSTSVGFLLSAIVLILPWLIMAALAYMTGRSIKRRFHTKKASPENRNMLE